MMIIEITQGQIVWFAGVFFISLAGLFLTKFYDRDFAYNDSINLHLVWLVVMLLIAGAILVIGGLNMDYKWLQIEVVSK